MTKKNLFKMRKDVAIALSSAMVLSNFATPVCAAEALSAEDTVIAEEATEEAAENVTTGEEDVTGGYAETFDVNVYDIYENVDGTKTAKSNTPVSVNQVSENDIFEYDAPDKGDEGFMPAVLYDDEELTEEMDPEITSSKDVYAYYARKTYTVTFYEDEDMEDDVTFRGVRHGATVSAPSAPTNRVGVRFVGWKNEDGDEYDETEPITSNVVYVGEWETITPITYYTLTLHADKDAVTVKGIENGQKVSENAAIEFTAQAKDGYKNLVVMAAKDSGDDIDVISDDNETFKIAAEDVTEDIVINVFATKIKDSGNKDTKNDTISDNKVLSIKERAENARSSFKGSIIENEVSVIPASVGKKTTYTVSLDAVSGNAVGTLTLNKGDKVILPKYDKKTSGLKVNKKIASVNGKGVLKVKKPTTGETLTYKTTDGINVSLKIVGIEPSIKAATVSAGSVSADSISGNKAADITIKKLKGTITSAGAFDIIVDASLTSKADAAKVKVKGGVKLDDTKDYFTVGEDGKLHITGVATSKGSVKIPFNANGKKYTITLKTKIKK